MQELRAGTARLLISTSILARGMDFPNVASVINYDIPPIMEEYLHRAGRAGRFGRPGLVINFLRNNDVRAMKDIERYYRFTVEELPMDLTDLI